MSFDTEIADKMLSKARNKLANDYTLTNLIHDIRASS